MTSARSAKLGSRRQPVAAVITTRKLPLLLVALLALLASSVGQSQFTQQQQQQQDKSYNLQEAVEPQLEQNYPFYLQSPLANPQAGQNQNLAQQQQQQTGGKQQRANIPSNMGGPALTNQPGPSLARAQQLEAAPEQVVAPVPPQQQQQQQQQPQQQPQAQSPPQQEPLRPLPVQQPTCLFDKRGFFQLDQCLARKPYPAVGLAAFKNDDLIIKKGLSDKYGCSFMLTNGLFKNYHISKFSLDSDTQCLDQVQTSELSLQFSNVSLYYLWQLRCLNHANQLLDDATLNGETLLSSSSNNGIYSNEKSSSSGGGEPNNGGGASGSGSICVGSSQSFGFAALQLSNIEAQVELAIDIYKNWRVTNVTLAMMSPSSKLVADHQSQQSGANSAPGDFQHLGDRPTSNIKEFTFDTIDGDELNWRYSHLYENWTRNRLHVNFLDQFKRFLWVSLQRCLSESSSRLPVKLNDLFATHKYN